MYTATIELEFENKPSEADVLNYLYEIIDNDMVSDMYTLSSKPTIYSREVIEGRSCND